MAQTDHNTRRNTVTEELSVEALITNNDTDLPEVYAQIYTAGTASPTEIRTALQCDRQTVHRNLDRLVDAGVIVQEETTAYSPLEPAPAPTVVQSLAELGSSLRLELCSFAVNEGALVVEDARKAFEMSSSNLRKTLNALAADGYLAKRSGRQDEGLLAYRVTDRGSEALATLDDPGEYRNRDGTAISHYTNGIEGSPFRTAYEIEDVSIIAQREECTVAELLAATEKDEKATRRRLDRLAKRGLLDVTQRQARNLYRPTPRTQQMISEIRSLEDERRLQLWEASIPATLRDTLPNWFFPEELFRAFEAELNEPRSGLADEYISTWKRAGLIEGNRHRGFRFVQKER